MSNTAKEAQILSAAEALFTSRRFHEVTMDDIRLAAGVGKGTIYRYFKDKNELFFRLITGGFSELCELLHSQRGQNAFDKELRHAIADTQKFFMRRRELFKIMHTDDIRGNFSESQISEWKEHRHRLLSEITEIIRRGVAADSVRSDIPAELLASMLLGMLRGFVMSNERIEDSPALLAELFLSGVGRKSTLQGT